MFDEEDLRELVGFQSEGFPVVSLYLDTDLTHQTKERCKLTMWELFRRLEKEVPQEDRTRVERFLDFEHDWQAKGIAAFSCQARNFWRVYRLGSPSRSSRAAAMGRMRARHRQRGRQSKGDSRSSVVKRGVGQWVRSLYRYKNTPAR